MESEKYILAKWLSGQLDPDEKADFSEEENEVLLERIVTASNTLQLPSYDHEKAYNKLNQRISQFKRKRFIRYAVAAAVLLLLTASSFLIDFGKTYNAPIGEFTTISLKDGTIVELAPGGELHKKAMYNVFGRKMVLKGNASFSVKSGDTFTVQTEQGKITVLGTKFDVFSSESVFRVICREGKVGVDAGGKKKELIADMGIEVVERKWRDLNDAAIDYIQWSSERSHFWYAPISEVVEALEHQFGIDVLGEEAFDQSYLGSFDHTDLHNALEQVFLTLNITYEIEGKNVILQR